MIKAWNYEEIIELWDKGLPPAKIIGTLGLTISVRQVQRIGAKYGSNKKRHSGRMALDDAARGGVFGDVIRQLMLKRGDDPNICYLCKKPGDRKMTLHHLKYENATINDIVFACWSCQNSRANKGLA